MNDNIRKIISKYEAPRDFTYAKATDAMIKDAELTLGLALPKQYIEFLKEFGHGCIGGMCTNGIGLDGSAIFVDETLDYRNNGLPNKLVVIENCDEWLYCIDAETEAVVSWDMSGFIKQEYDCFDSYLMDQMKEAIDNL